MTYHLHLPEQLTNLYSFIISTDVDHDVLTIHRDKEILKFCDVSVTLTKTPRAPDAG